MLTSKTAGLNCKLIAILDGDIEEEYRKSYCNDTFFFDKERKGKQIISFLPISSLEKTLKNKLIDSPDNDFIKKLNDNYFNVRSLDDIIRDYKNNYNKDNNGKHLFKLLCSCYSEMGNSIEIFKNNLCKDIIGTINTSKRNEIEKYIQNVVK